MLSSPIGIKESNEVEVIAMRRVNSFNALTWITKDKQYSRLLAADVNMSLNRKDHFTEVRDLFVQWERRIAW